MAKNIPYNTIPNAIVTDVGNNSPAYAPKNVPMTHPNVAMNIIPYIYIGLRGSFCAEQTPKISSVIP